MLGNFSEDAQFILLKARDEMLALHHPYIGTEHLVLSILKNDCDMSSKLEDSYHLTYDNFREEIIHVIGVGKKKSQFFLHTPLLKKIMENAMLDARDNNNGEVTIGHLFFALLEEGEGIAIRIFIGMGIPVDDMYDDFGATLIKREKKKKKKLLLDDIGVDLVEKARIHGFDPVIGREHEIERLIEILCRRGKNNPILIGDAGVGKTAIVEALAHLISNGNVPHILQDKRIISLNMASIVSGTKYRGEFEERMQKLIKEVEDSGNIILFIDEIHTLVGAGGAEGAIDASNILKPALARGTIRVIGATTGFEYKKFIEEDKALDRRFQKIMIKEPNREETFHILEKLKGIYEGYHHVIVNDDILRAIVDLSDCYIFNRHNPDKVIDVLDEVCSMVSIREYDDDKKFSSLKRNLLEVQKKKNAFILDNDVKKAYLCLKEENSLKNEIHHLELSSNKRKKYVTLQDVAVIIHQKSGVPIYEIMKDDMTSFEMLEKGLKKKFIGQDEAIDMLVNASKKVRLGYSNHKVNSYLFVGKSGVGKTGIAKEYASLVVGKDNFIRLDMSEYSDSSSVSKFLGSNPGYVGYDDYNSVLSKLKDKPYSVILLDEVDKAHPSVLNLLYQMLDEGRIKDSRNQEICLHHSTIIMTSNLGFEDTKVGFDANYSLSSSLSERFSPSLVNRINHIIVFHSLTYDNVVAIVKNRLEILKNKYSDFRYSTSLIKDIALESQYEKYGARRIDKVIESKLENIIIDKILHHEELVIHHLKELEKA